MRTLTIALALACLLFVAQPAAADGMIEGTPQMVGQCTKMPFPPGSYSSSDGTEVTSVGYLMTRGQPAMYAIVCKNGWSFTLLKVTGSGPGSSEQLAAGTSLQEMLTALKTHCG
ncbi:MAG: hypothetical protein ACOCVM_00285 [Desulfovibrionaceae bacterium]